MFSTKTTLSTWSASNQYIAAIAMYQDIAGSGRISGKIKVTTIREKAAHLWYTAQWEPDTTQLLPTRILTISNLCHKLAVDHSLTSMTRPKFYYGILELRLLFERLQQQTD